LHDERESSPRISTEAGRQIDCNDEQLESADAPIRISFDPASNANDERDLHDERESSPRISTEAGRQSAFNDEEFAND
jgi:hypothetical protein